MGALTDAYEAAPKAVVYAAALTSVGVAVARALMSHGAGGASGGADDRGEMRLAQLAQLCAWVALAALAGRAWGHTVVAFGLAEARQWENIRLIVVESRWGQDWQWQVLATLALLAGAVLASNKRQGAWSMYALAAIAFCWTLAMLGHAAGSGWRVALHTVHLVAAGAWLGTLAAFVVLRARMTKAAEAAEASSRIVFSALGSFSPVALACASIVGLTGLTASVLYLAGFQNLWLTSYGRMLLFKLAAVLGVAVCGQLNWRRVRSHQPPQLSLMATEVALAGVVVAATSVLTELEHP